MSHHIYIGVATHKEYQMPNSKSYIPIHVGSQGKTPIATYTPDNQKDNISLKNPNYCELTATYYIWKNVQADYKGLVHYRRHFSTANKFNEFRAGTFDNVLSEKELVTIFDRNKYDAILPIKRKYYIESLYSHYKHTHNVKDLDVVRNVINDKFPDYLDAFDQVMKRTQAHMFNMYIMKSEYYDAYAQWLFDILFELEKRIDVSSYDVQEARVFGYISELLLDVWLEKNPLNQFEKPVMFMEKQNWIKKNGKFLLNKFQIRNLQTR